MRREWQPGDVAMSHRGLAVVSERCDRHFANGPHWHYHDGAWDGINDPLSAGKFRPLVVIDAEDREQVEVLGRSIRDSAFRSGDSYPGMGRLADGIQAALREFANPRPEVYSHLAAVESAEGVVTAVCGKTWTPKPNVTVVGRCPECENAAESGWVA